MGLKSGDSVTVTKIEPPASPDDKAIVEATLVDSDTGRFTEQAEEVFNEWFDMYSIEEGFMTPLTATYFIKGATNEVVEANEPRIMKNLFEQYDRDNDN